MTTLLAARQVSKSFGGVHAAHAVDFDVRPGEVHALVGQNGAGKSTLIKVLSGALLPDDGQVLYEDQPVHLSSPKAAQDLGIATVYQDPLVYPELSVVENIFMGREIRDRLGNVDWQTQQQRAARLFAELGINATFLAEPIGRLSLGVQQLVLTAKALSYASRVIIFDEPTAILTGGETERLFTVIRRLRESQLGVIYISHRLEEIFQIADRVTVMKDGEVRGTFPVGGIARDRLIDLMAGQIFQAGVHGDGDRIREPILRVQSLSGPPEVDDVTFDLRRGEVLGMFGLVGSGRTEIARMLFGISQPSAGTITFNGKNVSLPNPARALELGIAYLPEDRKAEGLFLRLPVRYELSVAILRSLCRVFGVVDRRRERAAGQEIIRALAIKTPGLETPANALSGGNQQKVLLGRWLASRPKLLILDEPTRGVDVAAKEEIHERIFHLADAGVAIIVISSELPEILKLSDRILVMHEGHLTALVERAAVSGEASVLRAATGERQVYADAAT